MSYPTGLRLPVLPDRHETELKHWSGSGDRLRSGFSPARTWSKTGSEQFKCLQKKAQPWRPRIPLWSIQRGTLLSWLFLWAHRVEKESWQFTGRLHDMGEGFYCLNSKTKDESRRGCICPQESCPSDFRQKNQHFKRNFSALKRDAHRKIKMK